MPLGSFFRYWWRTILGVLLLGLSLSQPSRAQEVAITFDDLPVHGPLPPGLTRADIARQILATLKAEHLPEVYGFINAGRLEKGPEDLEVLKLWREAGEPLGNHTYDHMNFNQHTVEQFEDNIEKNEPVLKGLMAEKDWHWFRYPYLWEGDTLEKRHAIRAYLKDRGYRIAQVSMDFEDYAWNPAYARCKEKKDEKSIAWLRDSYLATAKEYLALDQKMARQYFERDIRHVLLLHIGAFDALMLPQLIEMMRKEGFGFITIQEAESDSAYQTDPDAPLKFGGTLLDQIFDAKHLDYPPHAEKPMKELAAVCGGAPPAATK
jgi:peptidoglycan/xylan/chitin deacetylase (PgdA/CDA1 family)